MKDLALTLFLCGSALLPVSAATPNMIVILAADPGFTDLGVQGVLKDLSLRNGPINSNHPASPTNPPTTRKAPGSVFILTPPLNNVTQSIT